MAMRVICEFVVGVLLLSRTMSLTRKATGNSRLGIPGNSRESRTPKFPAGIPGNF